MLAMYPMVRVSVKRGYNLTASFPPTWAPRRREWKVRRGGRCDAAVPDPLSARHLNKGYAPMVLRYHGACPIIADRWAILR